MDLYLCFYYHKKIIHNDTQLIFIYKYKSISPEIGFAFNLFSNDFSIEFYKDNKKLSSVSESNIEKFKKLFEFTNHNQSFTINKCCNKCRCYKYSSNPFILDLKHRHIKFTSSGKSFRKSYEYFGLSNLIKNEYQIFRLLNSFYLPKASYLTFWTAKTPKGSALTSSVPRSASHLDLPLIKFSSKEKTINKIANLISIL